MPSAFRCPATAFPPCARRSIAYARERLTPADFERVLHYDGELPLHEITPAFYDCVQQLDPFGMSNPEPVFAAHAARVAFAPKILKEKHVKMRLLQLSCSTFEGSECHHPVGGDGPENAKRETRNVKSAAFEALGWRMAERVQQASILAGDLVDVLFTLEVNDHPDYGGLELRLEDVVKSAPVQSVAGAAQ